MTISAISVRGFKSLFEEQTIQLAPITIFSGANSGGKSSASQPLLLLKQTIESQYDPGTLLLYGPNVKFTSSTQVLSHGSGFAGRRDFTLEFHHKDRWRFKVKYDFPPNSPPRASRVDVHTPGGAISYGDKTALSFDQVVPILGPRDRFTLEMAEHYRSQPDTTLKWVATQERCFPDLSFTVNFGRHNNEDAEIQLAPLSYSGALRQLLKNVIHIRGLRGNPERSYFATARTKGGFPGAFEDYVASILMHWQSANSSLLRELGKDLRSLGLTWKVKAVPIQDTHAEILVGRLESPAQGGANDLVSLADVGLGVSQILPFLVALRVAKRGQIVFVEQPEIHLHPRAQFRLADVIVAAAKRGVIVWLETHSSVLIRGIQTQIAEGSYPANGVALNWFQRSGSTGGTEVTSCSPDELGRLGAWPSDFDDVSLNADRAFLDAVTRAKGRQ